MAPMVNVARSVVICFAIASATKMSWNTAVAEDRRQYEAIHEAELVGHRRRHVDTSFGRNMQALGERDEVGEHRVGGVQHALRLARRAGGVGIGSARRGERRRVLRSPSSASVTSAASRASKDSAPTPSTMKT